MNGGGGAKTLTYGIRKNKYWSRKNLVIVAKPMEIFFWRQIGHQNRTILKKCHKKMAKSGK